jgi:hypothetical protein
MRERNEDDADIERLKSLVELYQDAAKEKLRNAESSLKHLLNVQKALNDPKANLGELQYEYYHLITIHLKVYRYIYIYFNAFGKIPCYFY